MKSLSDKKRKRAMLIATTGIIALSLGIWVALSTTEKPTLVSKIQVMYTANAEPLSKHESTYDKNGRVVLYIHYKWTNNHWEGCTKTEKSFDALGQLTEIFHQKWESGKWTPTSKTSYVCIGNSNTLDGKDFTYDNGDWIEDSSTKRTLIYETNNQCTLVTDCTCDSAIWRDMSYRDIEYDYNGVTTNRLYSYFGKPYYSFRCHFDDNKHVKTRAVYRNTANSWSIIGKTTYVCDEKGRLKDISEYTSTHYSWTPKTIRTYKEYDKKGNPTLAFLTTTTGQNQRTKAGYEIATYRYSNQKAANDDAKKPKVTVLDQKINIEGDFSRVTVYTLEGEMIYSGIDRDFAIEPGVYILKADNLLEKICLL